MLKRYPVKIVFPPERHGRENIQDAEISLWNCPQPGDAVRIGGEYYKVNNLVSLTNEIVIVLGGKAEGYKANEAFNPETEFGVCFLDYSNWLLGTLTVTDRPALLARKDEGISANNVVEFASGRRFKIHHLQHEESGSIIVFHSRECNYYGIPV